MSRGRPAAPAWDLSGRFADLGADLCARLPELSHIDPDRVLFALSRSKADGTHGVYARIAPLRFAGGEPEHTRRRGRTLETFRMPALAHEGREILYVVYFMVPRFLRLSPEQKLGTVVHELYHISERFDGDIRRFPGRNFAHGSSRAAYNRIVSALVSRYMAAGPEPRLLEVLHLTEEQWQRREIRLTGLTVPLPRARLVARRRL